MIEARGLGIGFKERATTPASSELSPAAVSKPCRTEVRNVYRKRFTDVRRDERLLAFCGGDDEKNTAVETGPGGKAWQTPSPRHMLLFNSIHEGPKCVG